MSVARSVALITALLLAFPILGSDDTNGDRFVEVLIPLAFAYQANALTPVVIEGAYGSRWTGEAWFHNGTDLDVGSPIHKGEICLFPTPCPVLYPKRTTTPIRLLPFIVSDPNRGALFSIPLDSANTFRSFTFSARVLELSRRSQPNGVEVPVVWEREYLSAPSRLIGIPRKAESRVALRVYDPRRTAGSSVRIDLVALDGSAIASKVLMPGANLTIDEGQPGYAAINDLEVEFPQLAAYDRFDILITPLTAGMEFWAFAAVTDRDTQHVLFITPDR
ncbi:MAG: hypothetical protein JJE51_13200 [Thermoanaerobaculia bacterium]|nr:hypothetical protein [Thermoanaerobaculia bacterium]